MAAGALPPPFADSGAPLSAAPGRASGDRPESPTGGTKRGLTNRSHYGSLVRGRKPAGWPPLRDGLLSLGTHARQDRRGRISGSALSWNLWFGAGVPPSNGPKRRSFRRPHPELGKSSEIVTRSSGLRSS